MSLGGHTLIISRKADDERDTLADVWRFRGGEVLRLARYWDPPELDTGRVRLYGSESFCRVLEERLGVPLHVAPGDLIADLPLELSGRQIKRATLAELGTFEYPAFVQPVAPKFFTPRVYSDAGVLADETALLAPESPILVSKVVRFTAEARAFLLDGVLLDIAMYRGGGDARAASDVAHRASRHEGVPRAVVIDVGEIADFGWAVVAYRAAWGARFKGCSAQRVWRAIAAASGIPD